MSQIRSQHPQSPNGQDGRPIFEMRAGGLHLTIHRVPYWLFSLVAAIGSGGGAAWLFR
ncbi:hypothetical protein [Kitasatospora sp. NPDC056181]|uniref:hypothetical protein n=1 Tax=Kitasatospora sp. NPDC056181 TaxID=3345737 RepID=UPI0035E36DB4